jgi:hypothetical protein
MPLFGRGKKFVPPPGMAPPPGTLSPRVVPLSSVLMPLRASKASLKSSPRRNKRNPRDSHGSDGSGDDPLAASILSQEALSRSKKRTIEGRSSNDESSSREPTDRSGEASSSSCSVDPDDPFAGAFAG